MPVLHVCLCSYKLLTRSRVVYSVGNGNKLRMHQVRIGGPHNLFALRKKIGFRGSSQLPAPCQLASMSPRSNYGVGNVTLALFWGYRNSGTWAASFRQS